MSPPFTVEEVVGIPDMTMDPQAPDIRAVAGDPPLSTKSHRPVLDHVPPEWRERVRAMLAKHAPIWSGKLGQMQANKHCIDLKPNTIPVQQAPYRAGPCEREFERSEVARMLEEGVT